MAYALGGVAIAGAVVFGVYMLSKGKRVGVDPVAFSSDKRLDFDYIKTLAEDMSIALGEKVELKQLECVMGTKELFSVLPKLSEQNFIASPKNIANEIFKADLHSHTWRSDGWGIVENILNEAAEYGDKLNAKTNEKFIFAITDHDGIEGVKEALKLITKNPEKYKNIKFVPGVKLSFMHKCETGSPKFLKNGGTPFEGSEFLVHCINPYSKTLNSTIDTLRQNRGQVKNRVVQVAQQQGKDPQELYANLMREWKCDKNFKSLDNFNNFLSTRGIEVSVPQDNEGIKAICAKYFPKLEDGKISAPHENTFESLMEALSKEKDVSVGFAHPAFLTQCFNDSENVLGDFIKRSNGLIQTTEKYHQGYSYPIKNGALTLEEVENTNFLIDKFKLLSTGGRDNHGARLFPN